jgi:hypothetical protein
MDIAQTRYGYVYGGTIQTGDGTFDHPLAMHHPTGVCWTEQPIDRLRLAAMMINQLRSHHPELVDDPVDVRDFWYSDLEPVDIA